MRQIKSALTERGESFDSAWVGRPDEKKKLVQHASSLRSMCIDATSSRSNRFFNDMEKAVVKKVEPGGSVAVDPIHR